MNGIKKIVSSNNSVPEVKKIFFIVNVDSFFLSHRLPLALAMKKKGYEVYLLAKNTGQKNEVEAAGIHFINIHFERAGQNPVKDVFVILRLRALFKQHQPDIIHNVTIKPVLYASIAARSYKKKDHKLFNAISGLGYNFIKNRNGGLQKILKALMRFAYSGNVHFIFQNPDDIAAYKQMGYLSRNNYQLIKGAGVDEHVFDYYPPIKKDRLKIVITARMLYDKGIIELIKAAHFLKNNWETKARFILAGDIDSDNPAGIKKEVLMNMLVPDYIEWVGHQKDVKPLLIESDIVCLPSYREGLPRSLIEAMAIGRPVITTDAPGCRECVNEGINGYLVPVQDAAALSKAIEALLLDEEKRIKMGIASREKMIRELSLTRVINSTIAYYEKGTG